MMISIQTRLARATSAVALALAVACGGGSTAPIAGNNPLPAVRPSLSQIYRASGHGAAGDVFVHLFEWRWLDIASECENVLGPAGVYAVQISPPQEHSVQSSGTWSERYQPVSYTVARSRSGTGAEFQQMVTRCKNVGVGIIVDAVINHMTNVPSPGTGSNGLAYTKYNYPGLYTQADFHPTCTVGDYSNAANVQDCELFGLPDLNTGSASVRAKIAGYLTSLLQMGVIGFRIDAAKHIQQVELDSIFIAVNNQAVNDGRPRPYVFLEVVGSSSEAVTARDYYGIGYSSGGAADITEFTTTGLGDKFLGTGGQKLFQLNPNGTPGNQFSPVAWGLLASDKGVIFLENHDTQRTGSGTWYQSGQVHRLANVFLLAQPYGFPSIMSSYAFNRSSQSGRDAGPPSDGTGQILPVTCATSFETAVLGQWVCEHRDPYIRTMVGFRKVTAGTDQNHWWDNGSNAIAFSRGNKGFVAINREATAVNVVTGTGLAPGVYCDIITGGKSGAACVGTSLTVDGAGNVSFSLPANTAVAVHIGSGL
jgi:alpha-amylase